MFHMLCRVYESCSAHEQSMQINNFMVVFMLKAPRYLSLYKDGHKTHIAWCLS